MRYGYRVLLFFLFVTVGFLLLYLLFSSSNKWINKSPYIILGVSGLFISWWKLRKQKS